MNASAERQKGRTGDMRINGIGRERRGLGKGKKREEEARHLVTFLKVFVFLSHLFLSIIRTLMHLVQHELYHTTVVLCGQEK